MGGSASIRGVAHRYYGAKSRTADACGTGGTACWIFGTHDLHFDASGEQNLYVRIDVAKGAIEYSVPGQEHGLDLPHFEIEGYYGARGEASIFQDEDTGLDDADEAKHTKDANGEYMLAQRFLSDFDCLGEIEIQLYREDTEVGGKMVDIRIRIIRVCFAGTVTGSSMG